MLGWAPAGPGSSNLDSLKQRSSQTATRPHFLAFQGPRCLSCPKAPSEDARSPAVPHWDQAAERGRFNLVAMDFSGPLPRPPRPLLPLQSWRPQDTQPRGQLPLQGLCPIL